MPHMPDPHLNKVFNPVAGSFLPVRSQYDKMEWNPGQESIWHKGGRHLQGGPDPIAHEQYATVHSVAGQTPHLCPPHGAIESESTIHSEQYKTVKGKSA